MAEMYSQLADMGSMEDMPYPLEPMDLEEEKLNEILRDLMPAGLENEVPETSLLYDQNRSDDIQDFCNGAEFDYSLPASGDGLCSPQMITTADVPGWVEQHPDRLDEDMNIFDCMDEDFKGEFWYDKNITDENEKYLSNEIFSIENNIELRNDLTPPISPLPFVERKYSVDCNRNDFKVMKPSMGPEISMVYESPVNNSGFISESCSPTCLPEPTQCNSSSTNGVIEYPGSIYEAEAPVKCEDDARFATDTGEPPVIVLEDEPLVATPAVVKSAPKVIRIPLSAVFKRPKVQPRKTCIEKPIVEKPKLSFLKPQVPKNNSRIVYVKKVSVPVKTEVKPEPVLLDVISGDGDELLKELLPSYKSEESPGQDWSTESYPSSSRARSPAYWDDDEDYQPSSQPGRKRAAYTKEEKKLRKKEQNKRAALRYREKKKDEFHSLATEIKQLTEATAREEEKHSRIVMENDLLRGLVKDIIRQRLMEME